LVKFGGEEALFPVTERRTRCRTYAFGHEGRGYGARVFDRTLSGAQDWMRRGCVRSLLTYADARALVADLVVRRWSDSVRRPVSVDLTRLVVKNPLRVLTGSD
jgi:hypothetical protein